MKYAEKDYQRGEVVHTMYPENVLRQKTEKSIQISENYHMEDSVVSEFTEAPLEECNMLIDDLDFVAIKYISKGDLLTYCKKANEDEDYQG